MAGFDDLFTGFDTKILNVLGDDVVVVNTTTGVRTSIKAEFREDGVDDEIVDQIDVVDILLETSVDNEHLFVRGCIIEHGTVEYSMDGVPVHDNSKWLKIRLRVKHR